MYLHYRRGSLVKQVGRELWRESLLQLGVGEPPKVLFRHDSESHCKLNLHSHHHNVFSEHGLACIIDSRGDEGLETGQVIHALRVLCRRVARLSSNLAYTYIVSQRENPDNWKARKGLHFEL